MKTFSFMLNFNVFHEEVCTLDQIFNFDGTNFYEM